MAEQGKTWRINLAVRRSATMPAPSRLIMLVLSDIADNGTAETPPERTPSLPQLAAETGQSLATVKRHLAELEADGWVERIRPTPEERVRRVRTFYRLHVPGERGSEVAVSGTAHSDTEHGSQGAPEDATRLTQSPEPAHSDTEHGSQGAVHKEDVLDAQDTLFSASAAAADGKQTSARRSQKPDPLERFPEFWKAYPRRKEPARAKKAWIKALGDGADPQLIIDGAGVYAMECKLKEPKFVKHPATWLNAGCWQDEPDPEYRPPVIGAPSEAATAQPRPWAEVRAEQLGHGGTFQPPPGDEFGDWFAMDRDEP